jgi:hypothetical protein
LGYEYPIHALSASATLDVIVNYTALGFGIGGTALGFGIGGTALGFGIGGTALGFGIGGTICRMDSPEIRSFVVVADKLTIAVRVANDTRISLFIGLISALFLDWEVTAPLKAR